MPGSGSSSPSLNSGAMHSAALLEFQQKLQASAGQGSSGLTTQALLKHQEDQLRAARMILQQRQLSELMASNRNNNNNNRNVLARGSVASLLGLSLPASSNQDALTAFASTRRVSVTSANNIEYVVKPK